MTVHRICIATTALLSLSACMTGPIPLSPQVRPEMPPNGALRAGEIVYVDDGSCPAGQIKRVIGGSNRVYGTDIQKAGLPRQVGCVSRP